MFSKLLSDFLYLQHIRIAYNGGYFIKCHFCHFNGLSISVGKHWSWQCAVPPTGTACFQTSYIKYGVVMIDCKIYAICYDNHYFWIISFWGGWGWGVGGEASFFMCVGFFFSLFITACIQSTVLTRMTLIVHVASVGKLSLLGTKYILMIMYAQIWDGPLESLANNQSVHCSRWYASALFVLNAVMKFQKCKPRES